MPTPAVRGPGLPAGRAAAAEIVAGLPLLQVDRSDPAAGYLATFAGLNPAQRIVALTLAVEGDATIPREVTESAETRLALARARIDAGDYDAARGRPGRTGRRRSVRLAGRLVQRAA